MKTKCQAYKKYAEGENSHMLLTDEEAQEFNVLVDILNMEGDLLEDTEEEYIKTRVTEGMLPSQISTIRGEFLESTTFHTLFMEHSRHYERLHTLEENGILRYGKENGLLDSVVDDEREDER